MVQNVIYVFLLKPDDSEKWKVNGCTGYYALCAAVNRALKEGLNIIDPNFYKNIDRKQLLHIFRADDNKTIIPLVDERIRCLHEVGTKLIEKYNGNFENCIKSAHGSAQELLKLIVTDFPCYKDEANYKNKKVSLYKRAQILIGDIWACYRGEGLGKFNDIETITMFADYRVPQVLIHFGTLEYSKELMNTLRQNKILKNGDNMEVEIRGASIYIVEELKKKVKNEIDKFHSDIDSTKVNSVLIDHFLWDYRRKYARELEHIPFHKVLSIYY